MLFRSCGKSGLFNRLTRSSQAITSHVAHTTRDQNRAVVNYDNVQFELVDSAGFAKTDEELSKLAIAKIADSMQSSDLVLFMIDGTGEISADDLKLSKLVLKSKKAAMLLVNKVDKKGFNADPNHFR